MMKQRLRCLFLLGITIITSFVMRGQLAAVPITVETTPLYGNYGEAGVDLTGYVMYEVYVNFTGPGNYLLTIFAAEGIPDCVQDADSAAFFDFPCGLFQHEQETAFGFQNSCFYNLNILPTSEFDSFITIGKNCSSDVSCDIDINVLGSCAGWENAFEGPTNGNYFDGGSFFWDEYAIYVASCLNNGSAAYAGSDNRVKIGQFTSCGGISGCLNLSYRTQAMVDNNNQTPIYAMNVCFEKEHPCLANPMDNTPVVGSAGCFGGQTQIALGDGGNGEIDFQLFSDADVLVNTYNDQETGLTITGAAPGMYYITMIDSVGCRDTTEVFEVVVPLELQLDAVLNQTVLCAGETNGEIELICAGGTGDIVIDVNGTDYACGDILTNLACGLYTIVATDENGCTDSDNINIICPTQLVFNPTVTNIECFGYDDGAITGTVLGGTGSISAVWTYNGGPFESFTGNSPLIISITGLDSGTYDLIITDANGCTIEQSFEITEPGEFLLNPVTTDASCFGICDGTVVSNVSGGTEPYTVAVTPAGGGVPQNPNALCAGDFLVLVTDDNNCEVSSEISIGEPTEITYQTNLQPESCFNLCDGSIQLNNVSGSWGGYSYNITPNEGNCTPPCAGNFVEYTDLCAGIYSILITDQNGCENLVTNLELEAPGELQLILTPTMVTCNGFDDGIVTITNTGGTGDFNVTPGNLSVPSTVQNLAPGTYTYTITDDNGCTDTEDVIITEPDSLIANILTNMSASCGGICDGMITYEVNGGTTPYSFVLDPTGFAGTVNGTITSLCANTYDLYITDFNQCLDTISFEIIEPDPLQIDINLNAPTCTGMFDGVASVIVSGGQGDLTLFIEPSNLNVNQLDSVTYELLDLGEGEIEFELNDTNDCVVQEEIMVVPDIITDMVLSLYSSPETCWNEHDGTATVGVQNGNLPISYMWSDDYHQTTATAVGLASNVTYEVVVTDAIGCTLTEEVYVAPTEGCFFITTGITPNGDGVNDLWVLGGLEFFPQAIVQVFNRYGQLLFESKGYANPWDGTFKGEKLPVADYYFVIDYADDKDPIQGTVTIKY